MNHIIKRDVEINLLDEITNLSEKNMLELITQIGPYIENWAPEIKISTNLLKVINVNFNEVNGDNDLQPLFTECLDFTEKYKEMINECNRKKKEMDSKN